MEPAPPRVPTWEVPSLEPESFERMRRQLRGVTVDPDSADPEVADLLFRVANAYARHSVYYAILAEYARPVSERRFDVRRYPIERWLTYESSK